MELSAEDEEVEDAGQIEKDVVRTLGKWTHAGAERAARQEALRRVLLRAFAQNRGKRHYFQGCNDVAAVLLLALGEVQAVRVLDWLMNGVLARWFEPALPPLVELMAQVMPLVHLENPACHARLCTADCVSPDYALSWVMTWFAHGTDDLGAVYAIFDELFAACLDASAEGAKASPPATRIIYLAAQTVLTCAGDLCRIPCDLPSVHQYFAREMPPVVTAAHAGVHTSSSRCPVCAAIRHNIHGDASSGSSSSGGNGSSRVIVVDELIAGARQLQQRWNWDALQEHRVELAREEEAQERECDRRAQQALDDAVHRARETAAAASSDWRTNAFVVGGVVLSFAAVAAAIYIGNSP